MANSAVATRGATNLPANIAALKGHLQNARANVPTQGAEGILQYKQGDWTFGVDSKLVGPDDVIAVNPLSIITGFVCWYDNVIGADGRSIPNPKNKSGPVAEVTVPLGQPPVAKHTLPHHEGATWASLSGFSFRFLEGEFKGREGKFTTTSGGGLNAVGDLIDKITKQIDEDPANLVPVLSLQSDSYPNKKFGGRTHYPVLDIEEWVSMDGAAADAPEPEADPEPEQEAPPARTRKAAAPAEEAPFEGEVAEDTAPAETAAPARRRRRS